MADRINPWPWSEASYPKHRELSRMPFDLPGRAFMHEFNREHTVAFVLADVYLMAVRGLIPKDGKVSYEGAYYQSGEGHEGNEAAHCLPRQLIIKGKYLDEFVKNIDPSLALAIRGKFGETDDLPVTFNNADSRIERRGLVNAFANACTHALEAGHNGGTFDIAAVLNVLKAAYDVYSAQANTAMTSAITRINERLEQIKNQTRNSAKKQTDLKKYQEQFEITKIYQDTLADSPGAKKIINLPTLESYTRVYSTL